MGRSTEQKNGETGEKSLAERLQAEVTSTLDTMQKMGIANGATVGNVKRVFPSIADRTIERILGKFKSNTMVFSPENVLRVVIGSRHSDKIGARPFDKALNTAIKEGIRQRDEEARKKASAGNGQRVVFSGRSR